MAGEVGFEPTISWFRGRLPFRQPLALNRLLLRPPSTFTNEKAEIDATSAQVHISQSKSSRPRYIPLNQEGLELFHALVAEQAADDLVFARHDGLPWRKNHHVRPLAQACRAAKVSPGIALHELRHTYASHLAQAGVDLLTISRLLGHSDTRTTSKHYAHLSDKALAQAVNKLSSFESEPKRKPRAVRTSLRRGRKS